MWLWTGSLTAAVVVLKEWTKDDYGYDRRTDF